MKKKLTVLLCGLVICSFLPGCQSEQVVKSPESGFPQRTITFQHPAVDLERGLITISGVGLPPKSGVEEAQAKLFARRAAIVDGQRNLAEKLVALERRAGLTPTDPVMVKNYIILEEKQLSDGGYRVVLQMKLEAALLKRLR